MSPFIVGFIVWISLLLPTRHYGVLAQLVNTTLHSTHPRVIYTPESWCIKDVFGGCIERRDPFTMSTYVDSDSIKRTFFQTDSWGNEPNSITMKRRVHIKFYGKPSCDIYGHALEMLWVDSRGRAVYVYGAPQAYLDKLPGHIQISLNGLVMETIDLEAKYREENGEPLNPQLLYRWEGGRSDVTNTLEISLLDDADGVWPWFPVRGFGFDSVVVTSLEPWRAPKYELSGSERLENITIHDTNFVASFTPTYAWEKTISPVASSEGIQTFHGTSNELAYSSRTSGAAPVAKFPAKCAALTVYGASPAQLESAFAEGFLHGHLQLCEGSNCRYIDVHQAYLNVPEHFWNEPTLLYSNDRMSPAVPEVVTMRLLNSWSPVGHRWIMSLSHAVCSQVVRKSPWTHPLPDGHYSNHTVQHHQFDYAPSFLFDLFSPWSKTNLYSLADAKPYWGEMPSWSTVVHGHDIKIFVLSPTLFPMSRYANVVCCIDGKCHYPDVEQWYLKARDAQSSIPLVHYQDLDPFQDHRISMTAVRKDEEVGDKIIAVSQIEHQQVVLMPKPSPTPTPSRTTPKPSQPTERRPSSPAELPPKDPDNGALAFTVGAMAAVILMSIWWCFALCLLNEQSRRVLEEQSLIGNFRPGPPGAANFRPPRPRYGTFEARIGPNSNLAGQGSSNGPPNGFPNGIAEPPRNAVPSSGHRPASLLDSTTNPRLIGVPGRSSRGTFRPALQNAQPTSPTYTDADIPPPYSDLTAPPSYDDCVTSN